MVGRLGLLSKVTALLCFAFGEKRRRLSNEQPWRSPDMSTSLAFFFFFFWPLPPRVLGAFDPPMCCLCLIKNLPERDYSTRRGESVEAKKREP